MVDEYGHQRLEEVVLDLVGQARAVPQVLPVEDERVRASGGGVLGVEAVAPGADLAGLGVDRVEVAHSPSGAVDRAEHVGAHAAQPRARHGGPERARQRRDLDGLEVVLARVPPPVDLELQVEVVVDAPGVVAPPLAARRLEAHAVVPVLLRVYHVDGVVVRRDAAVELLRLHAGVDAPVHGAVVRLPRPPHGRVGEVLELLVGEVVPPYLEVDDRARHLVRVGRAAAAAGRLVAEEAPAVGWEGPVASVAAADEARLRDEVAPDPVAPGADVGTGVVGAVPPRVLEEGQRQGRQDDGRRRYDPAERLGVVHPLVPVVARAGLNIVSDYACQFTKWS